MNLVDHVKEHIKEDNIKFYNEERFHETFKYKNAMNVYRAGILANLALSKAFLDWNKKY